MRRTALLLSFAIALLQVPRSSAFSVQRAATSPAVPARTALFQASRAEELNQRSGSSSVPPQTSSSETSSESRTKQDAEETTVPPFPIVLWKFTRPHTLIGSALAIPALHGLAAPSWHAILSPVFWYSIAYASLPSLLMNLYITGLNQITDVEIDKINKPHLPIAAGILKPRTAKWTVAVALLISLTMGYFSTPGLNMVLWGSGILGTLYSMPPFRLKRFPVLAAFCIVAVRGTIINASFFSHAQTAVFGSTQSVLQCLLNDPKCLYSSLFFGIFGMVIALMKDVPDVLGDRLNEIRTFSVRVGPQRIFRNSRRLLSALFFCTSAAFLRSALLAETKGMILCRSITSVCSLAAGLSVRQKANAVDPENPKQVYKYYMHLWKLFYLCYLVLPLAR